MIRLYGSFTSPFVRRVRYIAQVLELTYQQIDTMTDRGQEELRKKTPIWKVPLVEIDGLKIWDSHSIIEYFFEKNGTGEIRVPNQEEKWRESNLVHAIDAAVESAINVFYLGKDGIQPNSSPYLKKQQDRVHSILEWVKTEMQDFYFTEDKRIGLSELALYTSLDWMRFRNAYPVEGDSMWMKFLQHHAEDENLRNTSIQ
jgi:glutathione S-transferase